MLQKYYKNIKNVWHYTITVEKIEIVIYNERNKENVYEEKKWKRKKRKWY